MVEIGKVYKNKKFDILVEIISIAPDCITFYLGYPKVSFVNDRLIAHRDKDTSIKTFYKLSSLEMELL